MRLIRRSVRDDEGSVLIAVVGIMVVLTVLAIGAYAMADDNLFQAKRERARAQALTVAEAGLEQVLWRLKVGEAPTSTAPFYVDVENMGRAKIEAQQSGTSWHVIATGNASGTPGITRTISADVLSMSIWDMFYADGPVNPGANGHINGGGSFHGSLYMRGNWPPTNGDANFEQGPFFVKGGGVDFSQPGFGNAQIGTEGIVDLYSDGLVNPYHINANIHTSVPDLPMPLQGGPELAVARNTAISESSDGLQGAYGLGGLTNDETRVNGDTTGVPTPLAPKYADKTYAPPVNRYYKVVDDDSVVNTSVAAFYIGKAADNSVLPSFGRPYDPTLGHSRDDFSWDATAGVLTVQGTVFIDARDLYIRDVKWAGKGTIVTSGNVHISGMWEPAVFSVPPMVTGKYDDYDPADPNGYPKKNVVGISASGDIDEYSASGWGVFYSTVGWSMDPGANSQKFHGEIVAPVITLGKHGDVWTTPGMGENVPPSMPGGSGQIVAISGWHEGRN